MYTVGRIDRNIYRCITEDIVTDEVIITDERIQHIKDRHPNDYEDVMLRMGEALVKPDYILKDNNENTGLVIKAMESSNENVQMVLRIYTSKEIEEYKNSIISCWKISDKRLKNYLRNRDILYRHE